jgi:DNA polymerase III alpha subunit
MINIALKTEYSFRQCFMPIRDLHKYVLNGYLGVADYDNTFAHVPLSIEAEKYGFTPIYGVRLRVSAPENARTATSQEYNVFIAKTNKGLTELYKLVSKAYSQFYYFPRLFWQDIENLHPDIYILGSMYENFFPTADERTEYQLIAGARKFGDGYSYNFNQKADDMRIIPEGNIHLEIAKKCTATISKAPMLKFPGRMDLYAKCEIGAKKLGVDLSDTVYSERLEYELTLIHEKKFQDYFKVVSDIITKAKAKMLVGPGRGSSGGSLLCYLLGITGIDPIKYGLLFERFIDTNRFDFPDIDTDYPDVHRKQVLKDIAKIYGDDCVKSIGTVLTLKAKSALNEVAMALNIPAADIEELKGSIIERSGGDARAAFCVADTFTDLEIGKKFIEKYPRMRTAGNIEGHATTFGTHAAGVIVSNSPLTEFCGVNSRENTLMISGIDAEAINLLKIDCLGLRTLSILMDVAKLSGFKYSDYYTLDYKDQAVFDLLTAKRYSGIFQFDGQALGMVSAQMGVQNFDDMIAITALGRPGALNSGGTARYIKRRTGIEQPIYFGDLHKEVTEPTYGVVVFQEQTMTILRRIGSMSWKDVNILRKAMSKSYGDEFFSKYKADFIDGAQGNGYTAIEAEKVWEAVASMGSYGFNKSHAVAYAMISYWTAWAKAHYPLEFAAANLNHAKDDSSAVKLLRDIHLNDGIQYTPFDPDESELGWTIHNGKLLGGILNLPGIGPKKAQTILNARKGKAKLTPGLIKKMMNPETIFDILFPTKHYWGQLYSDPKSYGLHRSPSMIADVVEPGDYIIIGCVFDRDLRSRNDTQSVIKRGGQVLDNQIYYLNLYLEDDTDIIKCTIPPFKFEELDGQNLAENITIGKTWFLVSGKIQGSWRNLTIDGIINLNERFGVK